MPLAVVQAARLRLPCRRAACTTTGQSIPCERFMLPLITYPLAALGLVGVPLLIAIYLLRNRFRRQPVSSLMLWLDPREARAGGTRVRRLQTPWLFLLELAAIVLLVLAAADPQVRTSHGTRPLVVVLDDSFSMLAGVANLAGEAASTALRVEAGTPPQALHRSELRLGGGETRRVILKLAPGTPAVRARLDDDELLIDNEVTLLPAVARDVRAEVRV